MRRAGRGRCGAATCGDEVSTTLVHRLAEALVRTTGDGALVGSGVARGAVERRLALDSAEAEVRAARAGLGRAGLPVRAFAAVHAKLGAHGPAGARAAARDGLARRRRRGAVLVAAADLSRLAVAGLLAPEGD